MAKTEIADAPYAIAPVYFDSALLAKFYLNESGRDAVRKFQYSALALSIRRKVFASFSRFISMRLVRE